MRSKSEIRRHTIIEVAGTVFDEFGFERASMSEIAARVGGSKATLYSYFPSKEDLFVAVVRSMAETHMGGTFGQLDPARDLRESLQAFGERFIALICSPDIINAHRNLIGESGKSAVGRLFFDCGPRVGQAELSAFMLQAMDRGLLRRADSHIAGLHLVGLLKAERFDQRLLAVYDEVSPEEAQQMTTRAVDVFMRGYAPD